MKAFLVALVAVLALSACTSTQKGAAIGGVVGAAAGAATTGTLGGAAVGGAIGAAAGALVGKVAGSDDLCYYRDSYGDLYKDECPT